MNYAISPGTYQSKGFSLLFPLAELVIDNSNRSFTNQLTGVIFKNCRNLDLREFSRVNWGRGPCFGFKFLDVADWVFKRRRKLGIVGGGGAENWKNFSF